MIEQNHFFLPPSNRSIKGERYKEPSRIFLVRFNPQSLLLQVNIVPNSHRLLMLHVWMRRRHDRTTRVPSTDPIRMARVHVRMSPAVVVIVRSRQRHRHSRRWWVITRVLVVRGRVRIRVLRRVRCGRGEHIPVGRNLGLRRNRRRRWRVAPTASVSPTTVHVVAAATSDITHVEIII